MKAFKPRNPEFAALVADSFAGQSFMSLIGAKLLSITPGRCEIALDHRDDLNQQNGFIHGGVVGAILDTAMGYAGFSLAAAGTSALTVEYKINLVAPADGESIVARGEVVRPGRTLIVSRGEVYSLTGGSETLCAVATQTLMILADRPDGKS